MSVLRLNHFVAKDGEESELKAKLEAVLPMIKNAEGCIDCRLLAQADKQGHIVILEEWVDEAAHKAALSAVPPETFGPVMALLAEPPSGAYYS